jgi:hypothetical protein
MAEVTKEPMYEVLKAMQARLARVDGRLDGLTQEVRATKTQILGIHHDLVGIHQELGGMHATLVCHEQRFDRIERRLELTDAPSL